MPSTNTPGALLKLIRQGDATTRAQLVDLTGMARSTVAQRIDDLLAEVAVPRDIADGPDAILGWVDSEFRRLLAAAGRSESAVMGIGIGLPGPVEFVSGHPVLPPIMPGWDRYDVRGRLEASFDAPVLVDNDVNIMALGEWWALDGDVDDFVFVKVGTGIGSGLILGGTLQRGGDGAAGDIGHIQVGDPAVVCRCGNPGCLEASAGGGALAKALAARGYETRVTNDVVALVREGNHDAIQAVQEAGRLLGSVLATMVNVLNPSVIMIGGDLSSAGAELLARVREVVYRRSTALATRHLSIRPSALGDRAGITGAAAMAIEHVLSPAAVNSSIAVAGANR